MVSVLHLRTEVKSLSPGQHIFVVFLSKTPNCPQKNGHKYIVEGQPDKMLGGKLLWTDITSRGRRNNSNRFILQNSNDKCQLALMSFLPCPVSGSCVVYPGVQCTTFALLVQCCNNRAMKPVH